MSFLLCWIEQHPGLASWGQFVGSMIAIAVAIGIANVPEKRLRKENVKKIKVFKLAIINIAQGAQVSMVSLRDDLAKSDCELGSLGTALKVAEANMATLNSVDLTAFPYEEMLVPFIGIKSQMERGVVAARKNIEMNSRESAEMFELSRDLDSATNNMDSHFRELREASKLS